ncbi:MAG: hypothetical protein ACO3SM_07225 [Sedimenticolaceae bacterium]
MNCHHCHHPMELTEQEQEKNTLQSWFTCPQCHHEHTMTQKLNTYQTNYSATRWSPSVTFRYID